MSRIPQGSHDGIRYAVVSEEPQRHQADTSNSAKSRA